MCVLCVCVCVCARARVHECVRACVRVQVLLNLVCLNVLISEPNVHDV